MKTDKDLGIPEAETESVEATRQKGGIALIATERVRQRAIEGEYYTDDHDDEHSHEELAELAALYATPASIRKACSDHMSDDVVDWFKPSSWDRIRELIKAGALCAAEIDRLQRKANSVTSA